MFMAAVENGKIMEEKKDVTEVNLPNTHFSILCF